MRRGDDQENGRKDYGASQEGAQGQAFSAEKPAKEQGHGGIDERIGADSGGGAVFEDVDVAAETDAGSHNHEVEKGNPRTGGDLCPMKSAEFSRQGSNKQKGPASSKHLHGYPKHGRVGYGIVL